MILIPPSPIDTGLRIHRVITVDADGTKRRWTITELRKTHPELLCPPSERGTL